MSKKSNVKNANELSNESDSTKFEQPCALDEGLAGAENKVTQKNDEAETKKNVTKEDKAGKNKKKKKEKKPSKIAKKVRETNSELKKVTWPSFATVVKKTGVVIAVVIIFIVILFGIDRLLSLLFNWFTSSLG